MKKFIVGCIIISVIVLALSLPLHPVASQSYTFVTTTTTATETYTVTSLVPTATYTSATGLSASVSGSWSLGDDSQHCTNGQVDFQANAGDMLSVTITASSQSMVVYILTDQQLTEWKNQQHCDPRTSGIGIELVQGSDPNDLLQQAIIDWTAPASGHYSILVEVFSGAPVTVTAAPTETNAETLYQTGYNTGITTISQTYQTLEPVSSFPQDTALILIAVIVALAIGGYLAFRLKKGKPELPHPLESPAPTNLETQKVTDKQFCTECGTSLPMGSKFCNKCGSKQE